MRGKRWLLLTRWHNLSHPKRTQLRQALALNRRLFKAYYLNEQIERLWSYSYEGAATRFLDEWVRGLRWQRLPAFQKLALTLLNQLEGLLAYCKHKVPFGVVEAINGNLRSLIRRGRGYRDHECLLLKAQWIDRLQARIDSEQKKFEKRREAFGARQNAKREVLKKNAAAAGRALKELPTAGSFFLKLLLGVVYGIAGVALAFFPLAGVMTLTALLGGMLVAEALLETTLAFVVPASMGRGWLLLSALASLALGLLILFQWSISSGWAIGTLVGVAVLMNGIARAELSTSVRKELRSAQPSPAAA